MVEKQQSRLEKALADVLEDIHKHHLRRLQVDMHKCSAKCCENSNASIEENYRCIEKCSVKLEEAEEYVVTEFVSFLNQLQNCADNCSDGVTPKNKTEKYKKEVEACVKSCLEKHISIIPEFTKHLKKELTK